MSTPRPGTSLFRNILANMGGYAVAVVLSLLVTPFLVRSLGETSYGAWSLVAELTGYYGMLDLGFRGAVTYYVANYGAQGQTDRVRRVIATAFWTLTAMGTVVIAAGAGLSMAFPRLMDTADLNVLEAQIALFIMAVVAGLSLPAETCMSALVGSMRLDLVNGIEVLNRVAMAIATVLVLRNGFGLIGLSVAFAALRALTWLLQMLAARRVLGVIPWSPRDFSRAELSELAAYGLRNSVTALAILLSSRTGSVVTGMFLGVKWVAYYSIGSVMVSYAATACQSVTRSFTPKFAALHASGAYGDLRRLYLAGARLSGLLAVFVFAAVAAFGTPFLRIWVGEQFVSGAWTDRSDVVMLILFVAQLPRLMQSISWQLLFATANVRFLMWLNIGEAVSILLLSVLFVRFWGIAGVAIGILIPFLASHLIVMPYYVLRKFSIPPGQFLKEGPGRPLLIGAFLTALNSVIVAWGRPSGWGQFIPLAALATVTGSVICFFCGLAASERIELLEKLGMRHKR